MLAVSDEPAGATPFADVSRSVLVWGAAGGTALGIAYAASPLSVWFLAAMIGLFAWAGRGLTERERRWALGVLAVAVVLRVMLISGLFLTSDHGQFVSFFWDGDGLALKRRSVSIRNVWLDIPISPFFFAVAFDRLYGWTTYLYVLAYIQYWLGPAPYAIHLLNVTLFLVSAVALYRVVRSSFGRTSALLGLVILLFLPTPFLWSVSALKESLYVFLLVLCLIAAVKVVRGRFLTRVFALVVLVVSILAIDGIRQGAQFIATAGVGAGLVGSVVVRRVSTVLLVLLLLPFAAHRAWQDPGIQSRTMSRLQVAAVRHIGNVRTEGHGYKLLDQRAYTVRISEALALDIQAVNWKEHEAKVIGKGNKERAVYFNDRAMRWLRRYLELRSDRNPALFANARSRTRMTRFDAERRCRKVRQKTEIQKTVTLHVLRHTFATTLLKNGCPIGHIQGLLGHERLETTCRYYLGLIDNQELKKAHDRFARW